MSLRQYMIVFCLLLLVTLGNSYSMKYVVDRLNVLETKLESESKLRRELETKLESESKLRRELETKLESESKLRRELETKLESENKLRRELETKLESESKLRRELETKLESESKLRRELETKLESQSKLRRSETEELFRMISELAVINISFRSEQVSHEENITTSEQSANTSKSPSSDMYKTTELAIEFNNLKSYIINGVAFEKQQNVKLRSELKNISKQLEADYIMFESRINEEIRNFTNDVSDKLTLLVSEERFNNLSDFVTTAQSELRNEARQSMITLKSDVESSFQKLYNNFQTVNITAIRSVERWKNVSDSLTIVTNERLNNLSDFVTTTQSELRIEARQAMISLKSDVESSFQKLYNNFQTVNITAIKSVERCYNVSDSLTMVTNDLHTVKTSIQKLSNNFQTVNITAIKSVERFNNVSDSLTMMTNDLHSVKTILQHKLIYLESCNNVPKSGSYMMYNAKLATPLTVYCDQETDKGGWLVIQRRKDGTVDFYRTWDDYKIGFGDIENEFWIGNDNLHALTLSGLNELRIDMEDFEGNKAYAKYSNFKVHPENDLYKLEVDGYSGNSNDSLIIRHNGMPFSTKDRDNDQWYGVSCSEHLRGAWWYWACGPSNLNGHYYHDSNTPHGYGIFWYTWKGSLYYSLKTVEMKIR